MHPLDFHRLEKARIIELQAMINRERLAAKAARPAQRRPRRRVLRLLGSTLIHLGERLRDDPQPVA